MPEDKAAANKREAEYAEGQKVWPRAYHTVHPATPRHTPPRHASPRHATPAHPLISPTRACGPRVTLQKVADSLVSCQKSFPELIGFALNTPDPMCAWLGLGLGLGLRLFLPGVDRLPHALDTPDPVCADRPFPRE